MNYLSLEEWFVNQDETTKFFLTFYKYAEPGPTEKRALLGILKRALRQGVLYSSDPVLQNLLSSMCFYYHPLFRELPWAKKFRNCLLQRLPNEAFEILTNNHLNQICPECGNLRDDCPIVISFLSQDKTNLQLLMTPPSPSTIYTASIENWLTNNPELFQQCEEGEISVFELVTMAVEQGVGYADDTKIEQLIQIVRILTEPQTINN